MKVSVNKIELNSRKNWVWIVDLLDKNPELEKIKINLIYLVDDTNAEDKFYKSLIKSISKLKSLKKFKLSLYDFNSNSAVGNAFSIKELYKLKNIEEISFESNCMVAQMWDDFIDLSQYFGSTLKKLKLDLGKTTPNMSYLKQLRSLIRNLTMIEVLELESFEIPSIKFWREFINCLTGLKNLRKIEVGNRHLKKIELDHEILPILLSLPFLQRLKYCEDNVLRIETQLVRKQVIFHFKKKTLLNSGNENFIG